MCEKDDTTKIKIMLVDFVSLFALVVYKHNNFFKKKKRKKRRKTLHKNKKNYKK